MKAALIWGGIALLCGAFYVITADDRVKPIPLPTSIDLVSAKQQSVHRQAHTHINKTPPLINHSRVSFSVLASAAGTPLIAALEHFWKQCHQTNNCDEALSLAQGSLTSHRFEILSLYPDNTFLRDQRLGSILLSQNVDLIDKVANVKMIEQQIWGDTANTLFVDIYAQYDVTLEARARLEDVTDADTFIAVYETLIDHWETQLMSLSLDTEQAKYEHGVTLIPDHLSSSDKQQVMLQLQQTYLSNAHVASITLREQEVMRQEQDIVRYQAGLAQLNQTFIHLRKADMSHLSEQAWAQYQANAKLIYRQDFFKM
ncbi:hypothetical protein HQQ94_12730 [Shewanella sp. VB17]|uniref:hypothetical protein n=1 Tax=Shewanella sp. VB17 TaxID=2739432 RepID=UPI0015642885|nr:hypothetical protein [Shewanella sp. VB17]NRD74085.1 hypothetical protein [Shewanella sp. VB17]